MPDDKSERLSGGLPGARLNELILHSIVDHAVVSLDADGIVTSWNTGAERILGWSEDEIVGRSADVFFTPEDVAKARPEFEMRTALSEGRAEDVRWHVRKGGQRFWGSGLMMPLLDVADGPAGAAPDARFTGGFVKIFRDRTSEHQAERRIALLERRASLAMRQSGTVGVYEIDLHTNMATADAVCAGLHGVPADLAASGIDMQNILDGCHPDDVAGLRDVLFRAATQGADIDHVYRTSPDAGPQSRWVHAHGTVQLDAMGRPARLSGIVIDITEQREQAAMQEARLRFIDEIRDLHDPARISAFAARTIALVLRVARAGQGDVEADGDTIDIQADWVADGVTSLVGRHRYSDFGAFASALHGGSSVVIADARNDPRIDDPEPLAALGIRSLVNIPLIERGRLRAVLFANDDRPRVWSEAEIAFMKAIFDATYAAIARVRSEAAREVMAAEMAHRMKNLLTVAQIVVTQTLRRADSLDAARDAVGARLQALGKAQDVLTHVDHGHADIRDVIRSALEPYEAMSDRIAAEGPATRLVPEQVLGLSLALHELATNAAKYGALSNETGRVRIAWSLDGEAFGFAWIERGGPPVAKPVSTGFGSTILERVVGDYFDGDAEIDYAPEGIAFRLDGQVRDGRRPIRP